MSRDDDDETFRFGEVRRDEDGIPIAVPRRTNPLGIPIQAQHRPSRRHVSTTDEIAVIRDGERELSERVSALEADKDEDSSEKRSPTEKLVEKLVERIVARRIRKLKSWIAGAVIAALGSFGAGAKSALDSREESGREKARTEYIREELLRLRDFVFRAEPHRRDVPDLFPPAPKPDRKDHP